MVVTKVVVTMAVAIKVVAEKVVVAAVVDAFVPETGAALTATTPSSPPEIRAVAELPSLRTPSMPGRPALNLR